jgi:hypothetical protein
MAAKCTSRSPGGAATTIFATTRATRGYRETETIAEVIPLPYFNSVMVLIIRNFLDIIATATTLTTTVATRFTVGITLRPPMEETHRLLVDGACHLVEVCHLLGEGCHREREAWKAMSLCNGLLGLVTRPALGNKVTAASREKSSREFLSRPTQAFVNCSILRGKGFARRSVTTHTEIYGGKLDLHWSKDKGGRRSSGIETV